MSRQYSQAHSPSYYLHSIPHILEINLMRKSFKIIGNIDLGFVNEQCLVGRVEWLCVLWANFSMWWNKGECPQKLSFVIYEIWFPPQIQFNCLRSNFQPRIKRMTNETNEMGKNTTPFHLVGAKTTIHNHKNRKWNKRQERKNLKFISTQLNITCCPHSIRWVRIYD